MTGRLPLPKVSTCLASSVRRKQSRSHPHNLFSCLYHIVATAQLALLLHKH
jgi:hypothetical protein